MGKIQFRNEDCLKTIETIKKANKKIDLVLTSPPYNTELHSSSFHTYVSLRFNNY